MKVIADLCLVPIGVGVSVSKEVAACERLLRDSGLKIKLHAYGTNIEAARQVMIQAVRHVAGVLQDKPVDALYIEMGNSAMIFRVRWWIESYQETRRNLDQVHTALQAAFDQAGIPFAPKTQSVKLRADAGTVRRVSAAFRHRGGEGPDGGDND